MPVIHLASSGSQSVLLENGGVAAYMPLGATHQFPGFMEGYTRTS